MKTTKKTLRLVLQANGIVEQLILAKVIDGESIEVKKIKEQLTNAQNKLAPVLQSLTVSEQIQLACDEIIFS